MDQVTVFDYIRVVVRAWRWLVVVTLVAGVVAYGYGLTQPRIYRATATVLAPRESGGGGMSSSLGAILASVGGGSGGGSGGGGLSMPGIGISLPTSSTNLDTFIAILKSRTLREEVLQGLDATTGTKISASIAGIDPTVRDKVVVALTVEATDPKAAATVANAYFQYLDRRLQRTSEAAAKRQEALYVAQLERAAKEVEAAEQELVKFQTENRMLAGAEAGGKAQAEGGAMLRGQIMSMELQREIMRMRVTDQHPDMREMDKRIAEMKKQYSRNLFGSAMDLPPESPNAKGSRKEFFVPAERMTPVQFAYLKLMRNLKIQEAFYLGAVQGLQQIQYTGDANRAPEIESVDPALPPGGPSRPNMRQIVSVGLGIGLVIAVCLALAREALTRALAEHGVTWPPSRPRTRRVRGRGNGDGSPEVPDLRPEPTPSSGSLV